MISRRAFLLFLPFVLLGAGLVLFLSARNFVGQPGCRCFNLDQTTGEFDWEREKAYFNNQEVDSPLAALPEPILEQRVLGETNGDERWIEVNLTEQKLRAWEGDNLFLETLVSSGKTWTPTVTGEFRIWSKFQYAKMSGGQKGTKSYYYLPNVPYIMFFHKDYALHGTYWHANFGTRMSHGCVNLPTMVAEKLYYWTSPAVAPGKRSVSSAPDNPGTRVVIHN